MQDEDRENVPEKHSNEDQGNAAEHEQAPRTQRSKRALAHFVCVFDTRELVRGHGGVFRPGLVMASEQVWLYRKAAAGSSGRTS